MALTLRLVRLGRRHRPFFRLRAADSRFATTGRFVEELGTIDPLEKNPDKQIVLNRERIEHWLSVGATTSESVRSILKKNGIGRKNAPAAKPA
ncbi:MAG: 30S ribosomal protein S16 [Planctomycetota bacterium]|nr:30S ribosomal protein S16 [Planctomycetota bacterium]